MAVTPEITTGNHIKLEIDAEIKNEISSGKVYLQAPAGLNVLIHFPTRKIIETFDCTRTCELVDFTYSRKDGF